MINKTTNDYLTLQSENFQTSVLWNIAFEGAILG